MAFGFMTMACETWYEERSSIYPLTTDHELIPARGEGSGAVQGTAGYREDYLNAFGGSDRQFCHHIRAENFKNFE